MAEFEELMGKNDNMDKDMDKDMDMDMDVEVDDEEVVAEAVTLQKVGLQYPHGGDNGENTHSPVDANSGKTGMDSKPVDFAKGDEKGRPAPKDKDVDGASSFQNAPGKKNVKLDNAPKPVSAQASGVNNKSVID